jgi:hypothetical protein
MSLPWLPTPFGIGQDEPLSLQHQDFDEQPNVLEMLLCEPVLLPVIYCFYFGHHDNRASQGVHHADYQIPQ